MKIGKVGGRTWFPFGAIRTGKGFIPLQTVRWSYLMGWLDSHSSRGAISAQVCAFQARRGGGGREGKERHQSGHGSRSCIYSVQRPRQGCSGEKTLSTTGPLGGKRGGGAAPGRPQQSGGAPNLPRRARRGEPGRAVPGRATPPRFGPCRDPPPPMRGRSSGRAAAAAAAAHPPAADTRAAEAAPARPHVSPGRSGVARGLPALWHPRRPPRVLPPLSPPSIEAASARAAGGGHSPPPPSPGPFPGGAGPGEVGGAGGRDAVGRRSSHPRRRRRKGHGGGSAETRQLRHWESRSGACPSPGPPPPAVRGPEPPTRGSNNDNNYCHRTLIPSHRGGFARSMRGS